VTPEEKAVIQAAIKTRSQALAGLPSAADELRVAIDELIYACNDCNYGKHQCPGCGEDIQHGDTDCGKDCTRVDVLEWIPSVMRHVQKHDELRIGTDVAICVASTAIDWHADNSNKYEPQPWEHTEVRLQLRIGDELFSLLFAPNTPVEILCSAERKAQLLLQQSFPGTREVER
jgi:hypothetical protein